MTAIGFEEKYSNIVIQNQIYIMKSVKCVAQLGLRLNDVHDI